MAELLVMRHAKSDWTTNLDDFDRPLNKRGHNDAPRMGRWLVDNDLVPDAIVSSSANRALTTAHYVAEATNIATGQVDPRPELYLATAQTWLELVHGWTEDGRLLVCGHNPGLDHLVALLASEQPPRTASGKLMTTAAVAVFDLDDWQSAGHGTGRLRQLVRPRELPDTESHT